MKEPMQPFRSSRAIFEEVEERTLKMIEEQKKDFSKVQRWEEKQLQDIDGDTYWDVIHCNYGQYVLYSDYQELLKEKVPPRLPADYSELYKVIEKAKDNFKREAFRVFEQKDEINYSYAMGQYELSRTLEKALHILKEKVYINK